MTEIQPPEDARYKAGHVESGEKSLPNQATGENSPMTTRAGVALTGIPNGTVPQGRPWRIALVDLGGHLHMKQLSLDRIAKRLNSLQNLFHFEPFGPAVTHLGEKDRLHCYSDKVLWGFVKSHLTGTEYELGIGITHERLDQHRFNRHNETEGIGLVTIADATEYTPIGKTLEQFTVFLILCEAFCVVGRKDFEHPVVHYCLFDLCQEKSDQVTCLANPHICDDCLIRLKNSGFLVKDFHEANKVLRYVGRTSSAHVIRQALSNPIAQFLLVSLLISIIGKLVAALPTPWPYRIIGLLSVALVVFVGYHYVRVRFISRRK